MKLVIAIINNDDAHSVLSGLTREGFSATKLSTTGGFLRAGNTTLLIGVEEEKVDALIEIVRQFSQKRTQMIGANPVYQSEFLMSMPVEVNVGGATVFVLDVDKFFKL